MEFNRPSLPLSGDPHLPPPNSNRSSSPRPSPSVLSYFPLQAARSEAGIPTVFDQRIMASSSPNPRMEHLVMGNSMNVREMLLLEKERIREEIIASEIVRRRILEAQVRRELMMEREVALRHADDEFSAEDRFGMRYGSRLSYVDHVDHLLYEHGASLGQYAFDASLHRSLQLHEDVARTGINRDKLIILQEKPKPNISGSKRKAVEPLAWGASKSSGVSCQKTPKEDWSCALCRVSMTSEKGLQEHLQGKKHKAKEARLRAEKLDKNCCKKIDKPDKTCESSNSEPQKELSLNELEVPSEKKVSFEDLKNKSGNLAIQKDQQGKRKRLRKATKTQKSKDRTKFKFWCEICQIGAHSATVLENHKSGKKHRDRLKDIKLSSEVGDAAPSTAIAETTAASVEETAGKVENDDGLKLLTPVNENNAENDAADADGSSSTWSI